MHIENFLLFIFCIQLIPIYSVERLPSSIEVFIEEENNLTKTVINRDSNYTAYEVIENKYPSIGIFIPTTTQLIENYESTNATPNNNIFIQNNLYNDKATIKAEGKNKELNSSFVKNALKTDASFVNSTSHEYIIENGNDETTELFNLLTSESNSALLNSDGEFTNNIQNTHFTTENYMENITLHSIDKSVILTEITQITNTPVSLNVSTVINPFTSESSNFPLYSDTTIDDITIEITTNENRNIFLENNDLINKTNYILANETVVSDFVVRKCCPKFEYFNTKTINCTTFDDVNKFNDNVLHMLSKKDHNINTFSKLLKCPDYAPAATNMDVSNISHLIIDEGDVFDIYSNVSYNHSYYCLEMVGQNPTEIDFTIVYCQHSLPNYDYYYDYGEDLINDEMIENVNITNDKLTVRKCCSENEYYNLQLHQCVSTDDIIFDKFASRIKNLSFDSNVASLEIVYSRLKSCPDQVNLPNVHKVDNITYKLRHTGDVIEISTGISYNLSYYCMEQIGLNNNSLDLTIALCHKADYILPKCCPNGNYFDEYELDCVQIPNKNRPKNLIDNYSFDQNTYSIKPLGYFLPCPNALPSKTASKDISFNKGRLCLNEECYNRKEFCIDYIGEINKNELQAIAYYCRGRYFVKCCHKDEVLDDHGCGNYSGGNSLLLKQLLRTRSKVRSFNYKQCKGENALLLDDSLTKYIQWWVGQDGGHIIVESSTQIREIKHYCIDDLKGADGKLRPSAYVCEFDVENMVPIEKTHSLFKRPGSLGKCCPKSIDKNTVYFFSPFHGDCQVTSANDSLRLVEYFSKFNYTKEHFHDFPKCSNPFVGYHTYPLVSDTGDHATLTDEGTLKIISMDGTCVQSEKLISDSDFCFEYFLSKEGNLEPSAVVCAHATVEQIYDERFGLMIALLTISCICLFLTLISLFAMRVRRGIVSIRKVNTLAGRILVSFVGSHFIGFVALSLTQYENALNRTNSSGCYILAGLIQFFNLATFCWNTSICLESLLLTIHIRISEWTRYFLHSLWGWGFPTIMTVLVFLMDAHKDDFSCNAITPNIGIHHCFLFGTAAKLLYFYLPILITLTANILFLVGAKTLRTSRLKRLEKGKQRVGKPEPGQNGKPTAHNSGMRIHQSLNAKTESLRIVLWTGGTWFLELAGFVMSRYILPPKQEMWYYYLWYIPTSLNALRGVGIFAIIAITPEVRNRGSIAMSNIKRRTVARIHQFLPNEDQSNGINSSMKNNPTRRHMSITTMISSIRNSSINSNFMSRKSSLADECSRKIPTTRSVSQSRGRNSSMSMTEEYEMRTETQKRSLVSNTLPKLQEEDNVAIVH